MSALVALFIIILSSANSATAQISVTSSEEVQAAFISNFLNFIERDSFKNAVIKICLDQKSSGISKESLIGKPGSSAILLEEFKSARPDTSCAVIVTGNHLEDRNLTDSRPLIIVNQESECNRNSHIRFFISENRVRFAINLDSAKRDGFQISSKLLALAKVENCS